MTHFRPLPLGERKASTVKKWPSAIRRCFRASTQGVYILNAVEVDTEQTGVLDKASIRTIAKHAANRRVGQLLAFVATSRSLVRNSPQRPRLRLQPRTPDHSCQLAQSDRPRRHLVRDWRTVVRHLKTPALHSPQRSVGSTCSSGSRACVPYPSARSSPQSAPLRKPSASRCPR